MNKFNKNISKVLAIITGFGMNFSACNPKAMMENDVNVNTQENEFQQVLDFVKENKEKLGLIKVVEFNLDSTLCYIFDKDGNLLIYDNKDKTVKLSNKMEDVGVADGMEVFIKFPSDKIDLPEDELNGIKKKMWIIDQQTSYLESLENKGEEGKKELEKIRLKNKIRTYKMLGQWSEGNNDFKVGDDEYTFTVDAEKGTTGIKKKNNLQIQNVPVYQDAAKVENIQENNQRGSCNGVGLKVLAVLTLLAGYILYNNLNNGTENYEY